MSSEETEPQLLRAALEAQTLALHETRGALVEAVVTLRAELVAARAELEFGRAKIAGLESELAAASEERARVLAARDIAEAEVNRLRAALAAPPPTLMQVVRGRLRRRG